MDETLRNLNDNLSHQSELYAELNDLANAKREAILNNKLHELESITLREEQLLLEAARLEKERLLWAERVGREMGRAPEELTLAELAERYPELQGVRGKLDGVVTRLQEAHEINTKLINQALSVIDFTVGLMTRPDDTTYNNPKRKSIKQTTRVGILDKSV